MKKEKILIIAKLLELADSNNDHEALSAMREANLIVKNSGQPWLDVLGCVSTATDDSFEAWLAKLDSMLAVEDYSESQVFLQGCRDFLLKQGTLTPKQKECIARMWDKFQWHQRRSGIV